MSKHDDDLDLRLAGTWRKDDEPPLARWILRTGGQRYEVWADDKTADALFALLQALPGTVERLQRERDRLTGEVEDLASERDTLARKGAHPTAARAASAKPERAAPSSLEEVPLSMIGTFRA